MGQLLPLIIKVKVTITQYNITNVCKLLHNMSRPNGHTIRPKHALEIKDILLSHNYIEISSVTMQYKSKMENCYWHRLQNVINVT